MNRITSIGLALLAVLAFAAPASADKVQVCNSTVSAATATCNPRGDVGTVVWVTDGTGNTDCTVGGGATGAMCVWNGSSWQAISVASAGASTTLSAASPQLILDDSDSAGVVDDVVLAGSATDTGAGTEDSDFTITVYEAGATETRFNINADAGITIGGANNNSVTITTDSTGDGEVVLPNDSVSTDEITDDTITFANISDSSAVDADTTFTAADGIELEFTFAHTSGDSEGITLDIDQADDGAATDDFIGLDIELASESGDAGDTIRGIVITAQEGVANTVFDAGILIDNAETTASTLTDAIIVTSTGVDAGVVDGLDVSAANITNAVNIGVNPIAGGNSDSFTAGATDATFSYTRNDTGTVTYTCADDDANATCAYDSGGTGAILIGSADTTNVTVNSDVGLTFANNSDSINNLADATFDFTRNTTGAVTLTCSDDDATCNMVYDGGGAALVQVGSADITSIILQTDDTGDGTDLVLPAQGVNNSEILNDTIDFDSIADALTLDADTTITMGDGETIALAISHTSGDVDGLLLNFDQVDDAAATDDAVVLGLDITSESGDAGDTLRGIVIQFEEGTANTVMDAGILIDNAETTTSTMTDAIIVTSTGVDGGVVDGLDVSAANITNGVNVGANPIVSGAATLSLGDASTTVVALTTDGTGDGEVTLPADSIGAAEIDDNVCTGVISAFYNPTEAGGTDDYVSLLARDGSGTGNSFSVTEANEDQFTVPVAGILNNLYVEVDVAPGAGNDNWVITLREDAGSESLTCDIDETATTCTDTSNDSSIAAGAKVNILVSSEDGGGADPTAAGEMLISLCWTPN